MVMDPPWSGMTGHNQYGEPLPYTAAQFSIRGDSPEGYAMHHLGRILPSDEQPQPPGSLRGGPLTPGATRAEAEPPHVPVEPEPEVYG